MIEKCFLKFYKKIQLTKNQKKDAKTKYVGVCKKLHEYYYPDTKYNGNTKLLIGSYGKKTHIRPAGDIDVIFIMPPDKFKQYDDNQSNSQSQLLQDIKKILEEKYPDTPIKAFGKVVVLEFSDTKHNVELLPAWENNDGTFKIPNSENGGSWEYWDPKSEIKKIKDSDTITKRTKSLIRMIKKWAKSCTVNLKSYKIENKVLDFFYDNKDHSNESYSKIVVDFFIFFNNTNLETDIKSYLLTALNRSQKAFSLEKEDKNEEAVAEWKKVFGDDFPSINMVKEIVDEGTLQLSDYSHCRPLVWPFFDTNHKVTINAYLYDALKTKKLGGVNSNGRNLPPGLFLKFISDFNLNGNFEYFWQVVNTGQEAKTAGDLRGNFFTDGPTRWEHTKYRGKHWIECFIVQNNICIARSGKFFINIK